jgi:hypothetical protein
MNKIVLKTLLIAGVMAIATAPTYAQNTIFTLSTWGGSETVTVPGAGNTPVTEAVGVDDYGGSIYVGTGVITSGGITGGSGTSTNVTVFCVDPNSDIYPAPSPSNPYYADVSNLITSAPNGTTTITNGGVGQSYYAGGLSSLIGTLNGVQNLSDVNAQQRADEVAWISDTYLGNGSTTTDADAQIAIWDIELNGGYYGSSVLSGGFSTTDSDSGIGTIIDAAAVEKGYVSGNAYWIQDPTTEGTQSFVYSLGTPGNPQFVPGVPEPTLSAFIGSMVAALGIMMLMKRRSAQLS